MFGDQRSVLIAPASHPRMPQRAVESAADVVVLDLEDAVAPSEKAQARAAVVRSLRDLDWRDRPRRYRVNGLETPFFYRDLIDVLEIAGELVDAVVVPKVERPEDVYVVSTLLSQIEAQIGLRQPIGIDVQIETALGLRHCEAIAAASLRVRSVVFGPGDYAASVGMPLTAIGVADEWDEVYPGHRFHDAMHRILVAGRAANVRVIDGPYAALRDAAGLRRSCAIARALGYDGKWCIHPEQIETVNEVFSPSAEEIEWARRVVRAAEEAERRGDGAAVLNGRMIDGASVRVARAALARDRQL
ncbi:MAG: CoA ester lyase [Chloroflexota bacterium]|nr:CoA ester lyase [Chloroflexota bacterium]